MVMHSTRLNLSYVSPRSSVLRCLVGIDGSIGEIGIREGGRVKAAAVEVSKSEDFHQISLPFLERLQLMSPSQS